MIKVTQARFYSMKEGAEYVGIKYSTFIKWWPRWQKAGIIKVRRLRLNPESRGKNLFISPSDLQRLKKYLLRVA